MVLGCLVAMGKEAQGALPVLEKLEKTMEKLRDKRMQEDDFKRALMSLGPKQTREQLIASLPEEQLRLAVAQAIKYIRKPELRLSEVPMGKAP